jgi:EmrB/QacA subfamily drug resistance transporter
MSRSAPPRSESTLSTPRIVTNPWIILLVLALGFFMILLDTTIVNVAIPSMIDGLHASLDQVLWVVNAYILVYAVLLITAGRLGDMYGPKRMFILGLVIFVVSSAACGLSQNSGQLIFFRMLQGVGGAILTPQSLSIITSIFPPEKRGGAFGLWAAVAGAASAAGPTLGGYLTTTFSWRAIFYVNVPIGIAAVILAYLLMPELTIHRKHHLDMVGVGLASVGLSAFVFALIEGQRYQGGRISDVGAFSIGPVQASLWSIPTILVAGIVLIIAFVLYEMRHQEGEPLLPLSLFHDRNFAVANSVSAIVTFGIMALFLPLAIFLQSVLGMPAENAGFVLVPSSLTSIVISPIAGRLSDRGYGKWVLVFGLVLFAIGMGLVISVASLSAVGTTFTLPLIIAGIGMGCTFAPMVTMAMRNVHPTQAGAASGLLNTIRQVGGAVGIAVIGATLQNRLATEMHDQAVRFAAGLPVRFRAQFINSFSHAAQNGLQVGRGQTGASAGPPGNIPASVAHQLATLGRDVFRNAYLLAMKPSLAISIVALLFGALIAGLFMQSGRAESAGARTAPPRETGIAAAGE